LNNIEKFRSKINKYIKNKNKKSGLKEIKTLLILADFYSTYGAYQSADRTLVDAEDIARENNDYNSLANINLISSSIYFLEGDIDFTLKMGEQSIEIFNYLNLEVPTILKSNIATIYLNTDRY